MEYYIHPPEHDAAQYQQYEYSTELLQAPHEESSIVNAGPTLDMGGHPMADFSPEVGDGVAATHCARSSSSRSTTTTNNNNNNRRDLRHQSNNYHNNAPTPTRIVYKKAPGAPKRFKSSYVLFFTDYIEKKKHEIGPDGEPVKMDVAAVSKECSQIWKCMPPDQRQYWEDMSEREKQGYNEQKAAYQGPWRVATNKVKKMKVGVPKRAPSAFFLFVNVNRPYFKERYPDMPNAMMVKACSDMWKELSESEKGRYLEEEKRLRAQYYIEAENWKKGVRYNYSDENVDDILCDEATNGKSPPAECMSPSTSASPKQQMHGAPSNHGKKRKSDKDPNAPKRSPPAFFLFVNHCRPALKNEYPELKHTDLVKLLSQKWALMPEEAKKPFRDHEEQLRQQYHIDIAHYKKGAIPENEYDPLDAL